jgi:hypothetical protein
MRLIIKNWLCLVVGSVPFLLDSVYEAYVLTPMRGPQMLGFVVAHTWLGLFVWPSALIYAISLLYSAALLLVLMLRSKATPDRFKSVLAIYLTVSAVHCGLLSTYNQWSPMFDR